MILKKVIQDLLHRRHSSKADASVHHAGAEQTVLNVGGGSKSVAIPDHYRGWNHLLLDIDPAGAPDIVCDARTLSTLEGGSIDAVYCSHNLEHYYPHDARKVLQGFLHVLNETGFAEIRVPDLNAVMARVVRDGMDIEDVLYQSSSGPITVRDVIYGWGKQIEASGVDFYAHKTGFTAASLKHVLETAGFATVHIEERVPVFEICALAFKGTPTVAQRALLRL